MDPRTKRLISEWLGKSLNGWVLEEYVNGGKSALVFKGYKPGQVAAIKVFDPEIIERFGKQDEEARIQRELSLVGAKHPNLIEIYDGGYSREHELFFVVMEFIDAPNLATVLTDVPPDEVPKIIAQVASAAEFLESKDIVHRDIKPDNIVISHGFKRAVLLDLGVIRPFEKEGEPPLTDRAKQAFIGTLQYSSPEFLLREEKQTADGYRAVTFYQLGAVLYDLLTRKRIFADSVDPYGKLVNAILYEKPEIEPEGKPVRLVSLVRNCLVKDPHMRLQLVTWKDFKVPDANVDPAIAAKEQIRKLRALASYEASVDGGPDWEKIRHNQQEVATLLSRMAELVRSECTAGDLPPRMVTEMPDTEGRQGRVTACFRESAQFGLHIDVTLALRITIVDHDAQVVTVESVAVASKGPLEVSEFDNHWKKMFSGVYDDSALRSVLASILFPAIAAAMNVSSGSERVWLTVPE